MNEASPPKRQKTGNNGPPTADEVARANSTAQVFVGHRQNRWMAGFTNAESGPAIDATRNSVHGNSGAGDASAGRLGKSRTHSAGTTSRAANSQTPVVQGDNHPGLPSPALTEGSARSPNPSNSHASMSAPSQIGNYQHIRVPSNGDVPFQPTPAHASPQHRPQQSPPLPGPGSVFNFNAGAAAAHVLPSQDQQLQIPQPDHRHQPPQPQPMHQSPTISMNVLQSKLLAFRADVERAFRESDHINEEMKNTGRGRLTLLEHALNSNDWFYIVLNQVNAIWSRPRDPNTPDIIWKVDIRAQEYLDKLLCPNKSLYPPVLKWLSEFPEQLHIARAGDHWKIQENLIKRVIEFCDRLPKYWDSIEAECKNARAPPLTQDLDEKLKLKSEVLIATAFRSIARSIFGDSPIGQLEELHKLDQQYLRDKGKRSSEQKEYAYRAFRHTARHWVAYQNLLEAELAKRRNRPRGHHLPLPSFQIPQESISVFTASTALNPRTPAQQTAEMMANAQHLRRGTPSSAMQQQIRYIPGGHGLVAVPAQQQQHQQQQPRPRGGLVFPSEGSEPRAQPTQPDTAKSALHQAHLRSPIIGPLEPASGIPRLYRYVLGYALPPAKLQKSVPVQDVQFEVPQDEFDKIPPTVMQDRPGELPVRTLTETSRTYRVRCATVPPDGFLTDSAWAVADNVWPDELYLELNDVILEPRRKLHHGRYLPIDLTHIIKPGANTLTAIITRASNDPRPFDYALSIEIVGVMSHESITSKIPTISAADSLRDIKKSLAGGQDDDELAITTSNLTITLFDPYSGSKVFDTPVRGLACKHRDCFDLETFLGVCKRECYWWPTVVDCWRCPICRGDARPQMLVVDGFLVNVRNEMAQRFMLDTRAIVVNADGSWQPKKEERSGERSESMEREEEAAAAQMRLGGVLKKVPEIIEID